MGVSKNNGTPKSSISIGFSIINHPFWGTPIFGNTHILYVNDYHNAAYCEASWLHEFFRDFVAAIASSHLGFSGGSFKEILMKVSDQKIIEHLACRIACCCCCCCCCCCWCSCLTVFRTVLHHSSHELVGSTLCLQDTKAVVSLIYIYHIYQNGLLSPVSSRVIRHSELLYWTLSNCVALKRSSCLGALVPRQQYGRWRSDPASPLNIYRTL